MLLVDTKSAHTTTKAELSIRLAAPILSQHHTTRTSRSRSQLSAAAGEMALSARNCMALLDYVLEHMAAVVCLQGKCAHGETGHKSCWEVNRLDEDSRNDILESVYIDVVQQEAS